MIFMKNAARAGSRDGERANRLTHAITAGPPAQPHCTPMPGQDVTTGQRIVQLRLIPIDGAWTEPYTPFSREGNNAAMSAAAGEGGAGQ